MVHQIHERCRGVGEPKRNVPQSLHSRASAAALVGVKGLACPCSQTSRSKDPLAYASLPPVDAKPQFTLAPLPIVAPLRQLAWLASLSNLGPHVWSAIHKL